MEKTTRATEARIAVVALVVLAAVATGVALAWLRPLLIPFVFALFLSYGLAPLVDLFTVKLRVPRIIAVFACLLVGGLVVSVLGALIASSAQQLSANLPAYEDRLRALVVQAAEWARSFGIDVRPSTVQAALGGMPVGTWMGQLTNGVINALSSTFLALVFLIYLLEGRSMGSATTRVRGNIEGRIRNYLLTKVALSAGTGGAVAAILALLGVDLALVFGVLAFVLNFIPNIGSIIATVLPIPVLLVTPGVGPTTLILAIVLPGTVQMVVGNVIEPKVLGDSLELHPVTVLLALVFWGMLWGVVGMLLAAPLTAVLKILFDEVPLMKPVADLMAGKVGRAAAESDLVEPEELGLAGPPVEEVNQPAEPPGDVVP